MGYFLRLKEIRLGAGKTQKEIASFLNIKQNTYSQYENQQREVPIDSLIKLARFYDVSTDYLLGLTDYDTPYPKI